MTIQPANRNLLWTQIFVEELARSGLQAVCIAPGSRSTPLVMAFAEHPAIKVYSHIDERSAAFFALGLALAGDRPVALVCSSGTATANFYPAIIEAHYSRVPLLVLTADRPPELRETGANQTVDQVKLYGDHVRWAVDVTLPEAQPAAVTLRSIRTLAARAYAVANGTANGIAKGAVHLNFPFRKPLEPIPVPSDDTRVPAGRVDAKPFTRITRGELLSSADQLETLVNVIRQAKRGAFYVGSRAGDNVAAGLIPLAESVQFPIFADALSNVRFALETKDSAWVFGGHDTFLRADKTLPSPDVVIQIGGMPTSQALDDWLNTDTTEYRALISAHGMWTDPNHRIDDFIVTDPVELIGTLAQTLDDVEFERDTNWIERVRANEGAVWDAVDQEADGDYFDGMIVADVIDLLPRNAVVFVANSLPVRHLEQFARPNAKGITVYCNRGASGIDGTVSSALGVAAANRNRPLALITGDLAFYHDMNGLLAIKRCGVNFTSVVINNDGGGIFYRLPVNQFDPPFTELFVTPHGMTFEGAAMQYGLDYTRVSDRAAFRTAFAQALQAQISQDKSTILEVPTDFRADDARRRAVIARVVEQVAVNTNS